MPLARLSWAIVLLLAAARVHAGDDGGREIGWVLEYSPAEAIHRIRRANVSTPIPVKLGTPLHAGDVLTVDKSGRVLIGLADGTERVVTGSGAWSVPETTPRAAIWRVMQSMLGLVEREGTMASSAVAKGGSCTFSRESEPIDAPVLARPQKVVAGSQPLSFGWRGGCPPYSIALESRGRAIARLSRIEGRMVSLPETALQAGPYVVHIRESRGRELKSTIEVVKSAPQAPEDLTASSSTVTTLAQAAWLADQDGGVWRLESARRLEPLIAQRQPLAEKMKHVLLLETAAPD